MKLRLDKFLSNMGRGSRNDIKTDIRRGKVFVNGLPVKSGSLQVDSEVDEVVHLGETIRYVPYLYLMLNKPEGYICATADRVHPTVIDLVPEEYRHYELFPVGRLDIDTTGLLLITNDGDFAHKVMSPLSGIEKLYLANISEELSKESEVQLLQGVEISTPKGKHFCKAQTLVADGSKVEITITEGKFHQVKKMFEAVGAEVLELNRRRIGGLHLDETLGPGEIKNLSSQEMLSIFR